jgi:Fe-S-cluster containining protein
MSADRDTARIHLRLLDEDHTVAVEVPLGPRCLPELLPAARQLTDQATALILDRFRAAGHPPSCRAGCVACCRHLVALAPPEALDLADWVAGLPPERQAVVRGRFAAVLHRLEEAGLLAPPGPDGQRMMLAQRAGSQSTVVHDLSWRYFSLHIDCPLLENNLCLAYERRPMVCREHHVVSPAENCSRPDGRGVSRIEVRLEMTGALARTTAGLLGESPRTIPLPLALEWAEKNGPALRQKRDGVELLRNLVGEIDPRCNEPFTDRAGAPS